MRVNSRGSSGVELLQHIAAFAGVAMKSNKAGMDNSYSLLVMTFMVVVGIDKLSLFSYVVIN